MHSTDPTADSSTGSADSHTRGSNTPPLLSETIGANLARIVASHPYREALIEVASARRWSYRELEADVQPSGSSTSESGPATASASGHQTPPNGP